MCATQRIPTGVYGLIKSTFICKSNLALLLLRKLNSMSHYIPSPNPIILGIMRFVINRFQRSKTPIFVLSPCNSHTLTKRENLLHPRSNTSLRELGPSFNQSEITNSSNNPASLLRNAPVTVMSATNNARCLHMEAYCTSSETSTRYAIGYGLMKFVVVRSDLLRN